MAFEAVLGMDADEVDRTITQLLTVRAAVALRPAVAAERSSLVSLSRGRCTRCDHTRGGAAGGRRFAPVRASLLWLCPSVGERAQME